jgi:hypothetical protein
VLVVGIGGGLAVDANNASGVLDFGEVNDGVFDGGCVKLSGIFGVHVFGLVSVSLPGGNTGSSHILRRVQVFFIQIVHFVPFPRKRAE